MSTPIRRRNFVALVGGGLAGLAASAVASAGISVPRRALAGSYAGNNVVVRPASPLVINGDASYGSVWLDGGSIFMRAPGTVNVAELVKYG